MKFTYILAAGLFVASLGTLELVAKCCGSSCSQQKSCTRSKGKSCGC